MPEIIYQTPEGAEHSIVVPDGHSVMQGAVDNNLPGIYAECGGNISCATCHVYLEEADRGRFDEMCQDERDMLDFTEGATELSRLSCQMIVTERAASTRVAIVGP